MALFGKPIVKREALFRTPPLIARETPRGSSAPPRRELVGLIPYNTRSVNLGGYFEIISPGAFKETLKAGIDVKALFAHDIARPLGRVKNGTLFLKDTAEGLSCTVLLPQTTYAEDLYQLVRRGDVTTLSFGFNTAKTREAKEGGDTISYLLQVNLIEVSFGVVFPAYDATTTEARKVEQGALARYLSSLSTEELTRLHALFCSPSSLREEYSKETQRFIQGLYNATRGRK